MVINKTDIEIIRKEIVCHTTGKNIYICGATPLGKAMSEWLNKENIEYIAFVDKAGKNEWIERDVLKYEELSTEIIKNAVFIVTQNLSKEEVVNTLKTIGVKEESIIVFSSMIVFDQICFDLKRGMPSHKIVNNEWKEIKKGKRCFLIGNGPSLKKGDLRRLNGEDTFAFNMIYKELDKLRWKPSYYMVTDRTMATVFARDEGEFVKLIKNVDYAFFDTKTEIFDMYSESVFENLLFFNTFETEIDSVTDGPQLFSEDIPAGAYRSNTVIYVALQLACYMGYKEIYLLGVDHTYRFEKYSSGVKVKNNSLKNDHASFCSTPDWFNSNEAYIQMDKMLVGFLAAKEYAEKHDIKIYNATRGGKLEVFPRVNFDELFD